MLFVPPLWQAFVRPSKASNRSWQQANVGLTEVDTQILFRRPFRLDAQNTIGIVWYSMCFFRPCRALKAHYKQDERPSLFRLVYKLDGHKIRQYLYYSVKLTLATMYQGPAHFHKSLAKPGWCNRR